MSLADIGALQETETIYQLRLLNRVQLSKKHFQQSYLVVPVTKPILLRCRHLIYRDDRY